MIGPLAIGVDPTHPDQLILYNLVYINRSLQFMYMSTYLTCTAFFKKCISALKCI